MFCYQCEQTAKGEGCTKGGVCGKPSDVAALQDLLMYALKGLSCYAVEGRKVSVVDQEVNHFTCEAIFSTLTNVNFDPDRLVTLITTAITLRESLKQKVHSAGGTVDISESAATFKPGSNLEELVKQGDGAGVKADPSRQTLKPIPTSSHSSKRSSMGSKGLLPMQTMPGFSVRKMTVSTPLSMKG
jgi:hydroxylamine reductase